MYTDQPFFFVLMLLKVVKRRSHLEVEKGERGARISLGLAVLTLHQLDMGSPLPHSLLLERWVVERERERERERGRGREREWGMWSLCMVCLACVGTMCMNNLACSGSLV